MLLTEPRTAAHVSTLRRDPAGWTVTVLEDADGDGFTYELDHLYLDMPLVDGAPLPAAHPAFDPLPTTPWWCRLRPPRAG